LRPIGGERAAKKSPFVGSGFGAGGLWPLDQMDVSSEADWLNQQFQPQGDSLSSNLMQNNFNSSGRFDSMPSVDHVFDAQYQHGFGGNNLGFGMNGMGQSLPPVGQQMQSSALYQSSGQEAADHWGGRGPGLGNGTDQAISDNKIIGRPLSTNVDVSQGWTNQTWNQHQA
jgi:hypothetical protein